MSITACTCDHTAEEMEAASTPWHRLGCPQLALVAEVAALTAERGALRVPEQRGTT